MCVCVRGGQGGGRARRALAAVRRAGDVFGARCAAAGGRGARETMLRPGSRHEQRKKGFKGTITADDARRKREEQMVQIRKDKREESLMKKRRDSGAGGNASDAAKLNANMQQKARAPAPARVPKRVTVPPRPGAPPPPPGGEGRRRRGGRGSSPPFARTRLPPKPASVGGGRACGGSRGVRVVYPPWLLARSSRSCRPWCRASSPTTRCSSSRRRASSASCSPSVRLVCFAPPRPPPFP